MFCCRRLHQTGGEAFPEAENQTATWFVFGARSVCVMSGALVGSLVGRAFAAFTIGVGIGAYGVDPYDINRVSEIASRWEVIISIGNLIGIVQGVRLANFISDRILNAPHQD
jgi:hypothetical protein